MEKRNPGVLPLNIFQFTAYHFYNKTTQGNRGRDPSNLKELVSDLVFQLLARGVEHHPLPSQMIIRHHFSPESA